MNHLWLEPLIPGSKLCQTWRKTASQLPDFSLFLHFYQPWVGLEHLVAAKDSRWGLPWRVSAICLAHPPKPKGFGARCSGCVSLRSTDDICSILCFSKERERMEFGYQLSEPNAMRKPSDQTQACSGSICWVKQSESGCLYLQKHFL